VQSDFVITFDRPQADSRLLALDCSGWSSPVVARQRFLNLPPAVPDTVWIYHNLWGVRNYGAWDQAGRRMAMIHSDAPELLQIVEELEKHFHGLLCAGEDLTALLRRRLSHRDPATIQPFVYPVNEAFFAQTFQPREAPPWVIGYAGRLVQEQKRIRELRPFLAQLAAQGISFRCEILGEGPERKHLERELSGAFDVVFHGRKEGENYRRILSGWDFMIFLSDYETGPISLLEGMALGVSSLLPDIPCMGRQYVRAHSPRLLYPKGDSHAAAQALAMEMKSLAPASLAAYRNECRAAVSAHTTENYLRHVTRFIHQLQQCSSPVTAPPPLTPSLWNWVPFGFLSRLSLPKKFV
jgi:glycosyltransferase involved in cell wall biosynthesis